MSLKNFGLAIGSAIGGSFIGGIIACEYKKQEHEKALSKIASFNEYLIDSRNVLVSFDKGTFESSNEDGINVMIEKNPWIERYYSKQYGVINVSKVYNEGPQLFTATNRKVNKGDIIRFANLFDVMDKEEKYYDKVGVHSLVPNFKYIMRLTTKNEFGEFDP